MKYIIEWDAGYGSTACVIEADTLAEAEEEASQVWLEEAQSNASYSAIEYTEELAEDMGAI